ncbi:MAG: permease prefix domain 1-containing protein [Candidatus Helarchaeota archaeon]
MNEKKVSEKLINDFLMEVESLLPSWLKIQDKELNEILDELKEHIEDKVQAFSEEGMSYIDAVRQSISEMGNPTEIADEYKRRGTPKYYITEELWNLYLKSLKLILFMIIPIMSIFIVIDIIKTIFTMGNWIESLISGAGNIFFVSMCILIGTTILFVYLSKEGYTPQDLKKIFENRAKTKIEKKRSRRFHKNFNKPTNYSDKNIDHNKMMVPKGFEKPFNNILGGSFFIVFGIIAIWQPITFLNVSLVSLFLNIVFGIGIFLIIGGIIKILHGIISIWSFKAYKYLLPIRSVFAILSIPLIILLILNPQIFPLFYWSDTTGFVIFYMPLELYWFYQTLFVFIAIFIGTKSIMNIIKSARLKKSDFYL